MNIVQVAALMAAMVFPLTGWFIADQQRRATIRTCQRWLDDMARDRDFWKAQAHSNSGGRT